ncbi:MAG: peptide MFS transporter [Pirellulales bacterium]|nr:peptide MFS transporter [Pirellulales bacterium]
MNHSQKTFLGHPLGLYVLFFTEMWERFSYYGMRGLLILYMVNYFRWTQEQASNVYKVYTSLVYVTPILGGYLADRYLGNRRAVIIGAILMAIGHFLMAFEAYAVFYSALAFLIVGNGFFKPNMSTQVGRLYAPNDGRRDGAYTIFYMGINLGAFLSPLVCGWLAERTLGGYHSGFTMAGIGMVMGLLIYVFGQPLVKELDQSDAGAQTAAGNSGALLEQQAAGVTSAWGAAGRMAPPVLQLLGAAGVVLAGVAWAVGWLAAFDAVMAGMGGVCLLLVASVAAQVTGGVRDRVLVILLLGLFVMFFWATFEQAGNALNLWADKTTNRYLTRSMPIPEIAPVLAEDPDAPAVTVDGREPWWRRIGTMFRIKPRPQANGTAPQTHTSWTDSLNPVPTTWFQSINALAIFVLAPVFAWLWVALDRRGKQPSIPAKMVWGLVLMAASMGIMIGAARVEDRPSQVALARLPRGLETDAQGRLGRRDAQGRLVLFHAGRLRYDREQGLLLLKGVLPDVERDRMVEATVPADFRRAVEELAQRSQRLDAGPGNHVEVQIGSLPRGFDLRKAGNPGGRFEVGQGRLIAYRPLADRDVKALFVAGGDPAFRAAVEELFQKSARWCVSPWWLFWSYILATLGELCLSPVGLSMVSKLAPARFATMLMGVWLLTSSFGSFAAGALGEAWGSIAPLPYFTICTLINLVPALVLMLLVKKTVAAMHGVN